MGSSIPFIRKVAANSQMSTLANIAEDPRVAMADVNRQIVEHQRAGLEVPSRLLRLSKALASECIAHSQGR